MSKQVDKELNMLLMNLKEKEGEIEKELSGLETKLPEKKENNRATELRSQLLTVYELKIKVLSELNGI